MVAGRHIIGSNLGHFKGSKWVPVAGCGGRLGRRVPIGSVVSPTVGRVGAGMVATSKHQGFITRA
jgi:hypothetical protein